MEATKRAVPSNWQVESVVREAEPALIQKINPPFSFPVIVTRLFPSGIFVADLLPWNWVAEPLRQKAA
jgi:hypothetical protein